MICIITFTAASTTKEIGESVLFQPVLKTYPMHHSWIITVHISLGHLELQVELTTVNTMYNAYKPTIISAIDLLNTDPSFDGHTQQYSL